MMNRKSNLSGENIKKVDCSFGSCDGGGDTLYLFTYEYPYGKTSETYIETEIEYLASKFKRVVVMPSVSSQDYVRPVPENVVVEPLRIEYGVSSFMILLGSIPKMMNVLMYELRNSRRRWGYFTNLLYYKILAKNILKYKKLKAVLRDGCDEALYYDYWFVNSTLALALLKKDGVIKRFFSRAHGFDVYDDRGVPTPAFINYVIRYIDRVFTVSNSGERELKSKLSAKFADKISTLYIGTRIPSQMSAETGNGEFIILSCSDVVKVKRLDLIVEVLSKLRSKRKVHWVHIGDGDCMDSVKRLAEKELKNIRFTMKGSVTFKEVIDYYEKTSIGLFINLSESEGLPVSIMEACSYGVPTVASDVGGVSEIVNEMTGVLVDVNENAEVIASKIDDVVDGRIKFDREVMLSFCKERFDSDKNYRRFVDVISKL